jgi:hypothetical protein
MDRSRGGMHAIVKDGAIIGWCDDEADDGMVGYERSAAAQKIGGPVKLASVQVDCQAPGDSGIVTVTAWVAGV